jgi:hypothetical protein
MSNEHKIESALDYINDVIADFSDAVSTEVPVNEISQLVLSVMETHLGAVRYILLGDKEKALGLLANFEISRLMRRTK